MRAGHSSCSCPECGSVCRGKFSGCDEVWAEGDKSAARPAPTVKAPAKVGPSHAVVRRSRPSAGGERPVEPLVGPAHPEAGKRPQEASREAGGHPVRARDTRFEVVDDDSPAAGSPPAATPAARPAPASTAYRPPPAPRATPAPPSNATAPPPPPIASPPPVYIPQPRSTAPAWPGPAPTPAPARPSDLDADRGAAAVEQAFEAERAKLERLAAELDRRAAGIDERAATSVSRAFDKQRAAMEQMAADLDRQVQEIHQQRATVERVAADLHRQAQEIDERAAVAVGRAFDAERAMLDQVAAELVARAHEVEERATAHARVFEIDRAWLERLAAELPTRAIQLDDRAEAHLRMLDSDRASLEVLGHELVARGHEIDARIEAHLQAVEYDRHTLPDELRRSLAASLPELVTEAVRLENSRRAERQPPPPPPEPPARAEADPIFEARQRSLEKRLDGLTRRAQEIDERVTTHLRGIDDDRAVLADVITHQDRMAQALADADLDGRHDRLTQWVNDAIPVAVAGAVDAAMKVKAAALSTAVGRVEKVRADTKAMVDNLHESSERMLEALFRRDQESVVQLQALEDDRAAMKAMLEGGRDEIAHSVVNSLPALVEVAVRTAMERYATERRSGVQELSARLKADSDVMRDALQRSFEKMMEALSSREQQLEDRAVAHVKELEREKGVLADLWQKAAHRVTDALPAMVAAAVSDADRLDREELTAIRQETERLRVEQERMQAEQEQAQETDAEAEAADAAAARRDHEHEAAMVELRQAVAELQAALIERDTVVQRQAAANERALAGLRAAMASRPPPSPATRTPGTKTTTAARAAAGRTPAARVWARQGQAKHPPQSDSEAEPDFEFETDADEAAESVLVAVVDDLDGDITRDTNGGRVKYGESAVPRAQRVERRILKIDDRDDAAWPALNRRSQALSNLLAGEDD